MTGEPITVPEPLDPPILVQLASAGDVDGLRIALADPEVNLLCQNSDGNSPYLEAVFEKEYEAASLLLDAGLDVNHRNKYGVSSLHAAAETGDLRFIGLALSQPDVNIELQDNGWYTPVHVAGIAENPDAFQMLADAGAKLDTQARQDGKLVSLADNMSGEPPFEKNSQLYQAYQRLPDTPASICGETLVSDSGNGFSPLDVPAVWHAFDGMTAALDKQGEALSRAQLQQTGGFGQSFLERGVNCRQLGKIMRHLGDQGEALEAADFLKEGAGGFTLLERVANTGQVGELFSPENWRGCTTAAAHDVPKLYNALPEWARSQVTNYQVALAELRQNERMRER